MSWDDNDFPDAVDPDDVEWMLVSWKIVPLDECDHCDRDDYGYESRQFDHLPPGTTLPQARAKLAEYKEMHRTRGHNPGRKNHIIFLCRVQEFERISDLGGNPTP
jgi:hypothetical protein